VWALAGAAVLVGACSSSGDESTAVWPAAIRIALAAAVPGDIISLRSDGPAVEWIDRRAGTINRIADVAGTTDAAGTTDGEANIETIATIEVSTDGEQRGLLGTTSIGNRRFAAWTDPTTLDLVIGEIVEGELARVVWGGTTTQSKAIGGHLETYGGDILLGLGELTAWGDEHGSGALVTLDPDAAPTQEPVVVSDGWNNPFAFTVVQSAGGDEVIWVADNAPDSGPDPERLGRGDIADRRLATASPQRAPSAVVELPDGRLGVCGFLDGEMWAYDIPDPDSVGGEGGDSGEGDALELAERAGTIGGCLTAATVMDDGSIVTAIDGALAVYLAES
jgi:hypothetical protein